MKIEELFEMLERGDGRITSKEAYELLGLTNSTMLMYRLAKESMRNGRPVPRIRIANGRDGERRVRVNKCKNNRKRITVTGRRIPEEWSVGDDVCTEIRDGTLVVFKKEQA